MDTNKLQQLADLLNEFRKTYLNPMINFNPKTKQEAFKANIALNLRQAVNDVRKWKRLERYESLDATAGTIQTKRRRS